MRYLGLAPSHVQTAKVPTYLSLLPAVCVKDILQTTSRHLLPRIHTRTTYSCPGPFSFNSHKIAPHGAQTTDHDLHLILPPIGSISTLFKQTPQRLRPHPPNRADLRCDRLFLPLSALQLDFSGSTSIVFSRRLRHFAWCVVLIFTRPDLVLIAIMYGVQTEARIFRAKGRREKSVWERRLKTRLNSTELAATSNVRHVTRLVFPSIP